MTVALFSAASSFQPPAGRQRFFAQTCAAAAELWKFQADGQGRLGLTRQDRGWGLGMGVIGGWGEICRNRESKIALQRISTIANFEARSCMQCPALSP